MNLVNYDIQITKAVDIRIVAAPPGSRIPYKLDVKGATF